MASTSKATLERASADWPCFDVQTSANGQVAIVFSGNWNISLPYPSTALLLKELEDAGSNTRKVSLLTKDLRHWDGSLLAAVCAVSEVCASKKIELEYSQLPPGLAALLKLASAVSKRVSDAPTVRESIIARIGTSALKVFESTKQVVTFVGEAAIAFYRFLTGRVRMRKADFLEVVTQAGPSALAIVSLISILVGLILAYVGAIQLRQFGAQIYVANLVGIAMAREMGGVMAGIILAGRTGAAFAAQLGTMQVNEEIDALKTLGISPMESLVLPRMIALIAMIPLLCLYAILAGILGGMIVSVGALGISLPLYIEQTIRSISVMDVWVGVGKSVFFGALVAMCGCYHGIQCGRSASAVGEATTSAVVSGIVCVVVADAIFAVLCDIVGI